MQILEDRKILGEIFESILNLDIDTEYRKEVSMILESYNQKASENIGYYFSIILNINHEIVEIKKGLIADKDQEQNRENINLLSQLQQTLDELIYSFINHLKTDNEDFIITLENIDWKKYENISETIGEASWCRLSYLDGVLELMSPSIHHEELSQNFAAIITQYCFEKDIECYGMGSTRLKNKNKKGKEPDVSYALYHKKTIPDIAVEVNYTSGTIKDLEIYADIGVQEVWIYDLQNKTKFYLLENNSYRKINSSNYFELLTPNIVNEIIEIGKVNGITRIKKEIILLLK